MVQFRLQWVNIGSGNVVNILFIFLIDCRLDQLLKGLRVVVYLRFVIFVICLVFLVVGRCLFLKLYFLLLVQGNRDRIFLNLVFVVYLICFFDSLLVIQMFGVIFLVYYVFVGDFSLGGCFFNMVCNFIFEVIFCSIVIVINK